MTQTLATAEPESRWISVNGELGAGCMRRWILHIISAFGHAGLWFMSM
jgi:hypothetical protein